MSDWTFQGNPVTDEQTKGKYGFTYIIRCVTTGRYYVGKKQLWFVRKVKGKKKRVRKPSDWKTYFGSSVEVLEDVEAHPEWQWTKEILAFHETRGQMNYGEIYTQFKMDVLADAMSYNASINGKWFKKGTDEKGR